MCKKEEIFEFVFDNKRFPEKTSSNPVEKYLGIAFCGFYKQENQETFDWVFEARVNLLIEKLKFYGLIY